MKGKSARGWERARDGRPPTHPRDTLCVSRSVSHSRLSRTCYLLRLSCSTPSSPTLLFTIQPSRLPFIPAWGCVSPAYGRNSKPMNAAFVSPQANRDTRNSAQYGCTTLACNVTCSRPASTGKVKGGERRGQTMYREICGILKKDFIVSLSRNGRNYTHYAKIITLNESLYHPLSNKTEICIFKFALKTD